MGGEPNASYFIDGVFVSGSISSATLGPVERVEIIRGPQSAQFGRATFAGAVNYITRAPTNEFEGEVRVIRATNDTKQLTAWTSGPIIEDKLQYFVAGSYDTYGGEWYNSLGANQAPTSAFINPPQNADNSKLGGTETKDFTGKLLWAARPSSIAAGSRPARTPNVRYQSQMWIGACTALPGGSLSLPPATKDTTRTPPSKSSDLPPRSGWLLPPREGLVISPPLSEVHRKNVLAHMPCRLSAEVTLPVASSTHVSIPWKILRPRCEAAGSW